MATKKKGISKNTDARNIAYGQLHELKYACETHKHKTTGKHPTVAELKKIMRNIGSTKQPKRSREKIYLVLKGIGYVRVRPPKRVK